MKKIILLISLLSSYNLSAINLAVECNGCNASQSQQKAEQHASAIPRIGHIYLFNFTNHNLKKYFVYQEGLLDSNDGSQNLFEKQSEVLKKYGITEDQIIDMFAGSATQNNTDSETFAIIYEITPTSLEVEKFNGLDVVLDSLTESNLFRGNFPPDIINPTTGAPIGNGFGAYDIIGNTSLATALYNLSLDSWTTKIVTVLEYIQWASGALNIVNLDIDIKIAVTFPDGSKGMMGFNEYGDLEFDDSSFFDSDGNRVPESAGDTSGRTYFFSGGQESSGFGGFTRRLTMLGVGYGSSSGGGSCTFRCPAQGCILTCKVN